MKTSLKACIVKYIYTVYYTVCYRHRIYRGGWWHLGITVVGSDPGGGGGSYGVCFKTENLCQLVAIISIALRQDSRKQMESYDEKKDARMLMTQSL
jgi:hypothetical protein